MKILIFGDIFGKSGLNATVSFLKKNKNIYKPDLIIANCENVSKNGKSIDFVDYQKLVDIGINYFTTGNHAFKIPEFSDLISKVNNIVVPANWKKNVNEKNKYLLFEIKGKKILLFNLMGQAFLNEEVSNPFDVADEILLKNNYDIAILDFHAEATAEKIVLANYLKNKVNIFYGTHTHVQTSDDRIWNNKMAYITDIGMTGVFDSAIGMNFDEVEDKLRNQGKNKFREAISDKCRINALFVEFNDKNEVTKFERIAKNL